VAKTYKELLMHENIDTVFFGPMLGELGWSVSRWHAYCRLRRFTEFKFCRSVAVDYGWRYPLYADFIDDFIPLPDWFTELGLEQDCYEVVPLDSPAGSVTPHEVYASILDYCRQLYNPDTTWTVRTPRGYNLFIQFAQKQMWKNLEASEQAQAYANSLLANAQGEIVVVAGRARARATNRNIPEHVWNTLVDYLSLSGFTVVITGVRGSSALVGKVGRNIINVIDRTGIDGLDVLIALMTRAKMSITSQSGPTLVSLLCETPSYIVGHEAKRHSVDENWLKAAAMFRTVPDDSYMALTAEKMMEDVMNFNDQLSQANHGAEMAYRACYENDIETMLYLMNEQTVTFSRVNVKELQQEIINNDRITR
jgi:hypothetical protein